MVVLTRVVRARHLRGASPRLSMSTEKVAVVKTFICAMIEKVAASMLPS